jgi:hypothetical protein
VPNPRGRVFKSAHCRFVLVRVWYAAVFIIFAGLLLADAGKNRCDKSLEMSTSHESEMVYTARAASSIG